MHLVCSHSFAILVSRLIWKFAQTRQVQALSRPGVAWASRDMFKQDTFGFRKGFLAGTFVLRRSELRTTRPKFLLSPAELRQFRNT